MKHNLKAFSLKTLPDLALLCIAFYDYLPEHACILMYSLFSQNPLGHRTLAQTCQPGPGVFGCMVQDLPHIMPSLDLAAEPIPLWWTTDFINASPPGTEAKDEKWSLGTTEGWVAQKWINMAHLDGRWLNPLPALLLSSFENLGFLPSKLETFGVLRIVGEFNCSCVGISRCLAAYCKDDTPNASWDAPWLKEIHVATG